MNYHYRSDWGLFSHLGGGHGNSTGPMWPSIRAQDFHHWPQPWSFPDFSTHLWDGKKKYQDRWVTEPTLSVIHHFVFASHILWIVCLCLICKLWASWVYESDSHAMTALSVSLICILWTIFQQVWSTWWPGTMRQTCWLLLLMARSLCGTIPVLFMLIRTFCQKLCLRKTQGKYLYTVPFNF